MSAANDAPPSPQPDVQQDERQRRGARILLVALIALCFLFITTYALRLGERRRLEREIAAASAQLQTVEEAHARLAAQARNAGGAATVDDIARNVLQLSKPDDVTYVGVDPTPAPVPPPAPTPPPAPPPAPIWQQWLEFFVPRLAPA
jgi:cell division protein FtsB